MSASRSHPLQHRRWTATDAFTLPEALVAISIGSLVLAGVVTTYIMSVRGFQALSNYWEIHTDGRFAVDRFASDIRGVSSVVALTTTQLVCVVPLAFTGTGSIISNKTVAYTYTGGSLYRTETISGSTTTKKLADNIYQLSFRLYDKLGTPTTVLANAKEAQLDMRLRKISAGRSQSEDYLSARLVMRNVP